MAPWYSKERLTRSGKWKLLAASVLAAGLIGVLCGLCESPTKQVCTKTLMGIASALSLTDQKTNAIKTNSKKDITSLKTILLTTTTSEISLNAYADSSLKKLDIFTAASMATKICDLTIMPVYSTCALTISSSTHKNRASLHTKAQHFKNYGHMASVQSANLISKPRHILLVIFLRKLPVINVEKPTYAATNTASASGLNPRI